MKIHGCECERCIGPVGNLVVEILRPRSKSITNTVKGSKLMNPMLSGSKLQHRKGHKPDPRVIRR